VLASLNGKNIAGVICFHFGDRVIYKYGASDKDYQHLRVNNLVMWKQFSGIAGKDIVVSILVEPNAKIPVFCSSREDGGRGIPD